MLNLLSLRFLREIFESQYVPQWGTATAVSNPTPNAVVLIVPIHKVFLPFCHILECWELLLILQSGINLGGLGEGAYWVLGIKSRSVFYKVSTLLAIPFLLLHHLVFYPVHP